MTKIENIHHEVIWPIVPIHITDDGKSFDPSFDIYKLQGQGVIPYEHLRGIQVSMCHNLSQPTAIVEFPADGSFDIVKTESHFRGVPMQEACLRFREYTFGHACSDCDKYHAFLFKDLPQQNRKHSIQKSIKEKDILNRVFNSADSYCNVDEIIDDDNNCRLYLEYDCPFLGFRELLFPIYLEENIIAVFFVGQIITKESSQFITRKINELSKYQHNYFVEYSSINLADSSIESYSQHIYSAYTGSLKDAIIHDEISYDALKQKIHRQLLNLEKNLSNTIESRREKFINDKFVIVSDWFSNSLSEITTLSQDALDNIWKVFDRCMFYISGIFGVHYYIVFGVKDLSEIKESTLDYISSNGRLPFAIDQSEIKYRLPDLLPEISMSSDSNPELLSNIIGIPYCFLNTSNRISIFSVPFHKLSAVVVLTGYQNINPSTSPIFRHNGFLSARFQSFLTLFVSSLSSFLAAYSENNLDNSLRVFGHEMGQQVSGLSSIRGMYFSNYKMFKALSKKKLDDLSKNIFSFIKQINYLTENAKLLLTLPPLSKDYILPFGQIIEKWKDVYRVETKKKSLRIITIPIKFSDPKRPPMFVDKNLFELLLYNILNNAIKYSFRGTNIYIDCEKKDSFSDYILTIINYGIELPDNELIWAEYQRGKNVEGIEGAGIGLYLVQKIAKAHDATYSAIREKISNYNVPLLESYINTQFSGKNSHLVELLEKELDSLKSQKVFEEVVAHRSDGRPIYQRITRHQKLDNIKKKTWKVTIEVSFPI